VGIGVNKFKPKYSIGDSFEKKTTHEIIKIVKVEDGHYSYGYLTEESTLTARTYDMQFGRFENCFDSFDYIIKLKPKYNEGDLFSIEKTGEIIEIVKVIIDKNNYSYLTENLIGVPTIFTENFKEVEKVFSEFTYIPFKKEEFLPITKYKVGDIVKTLDKYIEVLNIEDGFYCLRDSNMSTTSYYKKPIEFFDNNFPEFMLITESKANFLKEAIKMMKDPTDISTKENLKTTRTMSGNPPWPSQHEWIKYITKELCEKLNIQKTSFELLQHLEQVEVNLTNGLRFSMRFNPTSYKAQTTSMMIIHDDLQVVNKITYAPTQNIGSLILAFGDDVENLVKLVKDYYIDNNELFLRKINKLIGKEK
jgi:hypothetical protein